MIHQRPKKRRGTDNAGVEPPIKQRLLPPVAVFLVISLGVFFALLANRVPALTVLMFGFGLALFVIAFVNAQAALFILVFSMLLSPEFIVGSIGGAGTLGRGLTIRLDDLLLAVMGFGWFARAAIDKDLGLFLKTPLNRAIFTYLIVCSLSTAWGSFMGRVDGRSGFFLRPQILRVFHCLFHGGEPCYTTASGRTVFVLFLFDSRHYQGVRNPADSIRRTRFRTI